MATVQVQTTALDQGLHNAAQLYFQHEYKQSIDICANLLRADRNNIKAHYLVGLNLLAMGLSDDALFGFIKATEGSPKVPEYWDALGMAFQHQGKWVEALRAYQKANVLSPAPWRESNVVWGMLHEPTKSARAVYRAQRDYASHWRTPHLKVKRNLDPNRRLKIGYLSSDLRHHSMQSIFGPTYFQHDHDQFEIIVYSGTQEIDIHTELYRLGSDKWYDARTADDLSMAREINAHEIDILVDLAGHSGANRLHVMSRKPAPVQVTGWGFAIGTGLVEVDYLFADRITTPPEALIHEKPWYLSSIVAFNGPRDDNGVQPAPMIENGYITFGYVGRATKVTEDVLRVWGEIGRAIPTSRFYFKDWSMQDPPCQRRIREGMQEHGVDSDRLTFEWNPRSRVGHLDCVAKFDVALDPWFVNGGATTLENCWMGAPTLTFLGDRISSRLGASIMTTLGHTNFIAPNADAMIPIAVKLAEQPDYLQQVRMGMRDRMKNSILCNAKAYCKEVEDAYRAMWQDYCARTN